MSAKHRILHLSMFVALVTMVIGVAGADAAASQRQPAQSKETSEILQFTSSGHVLGFHTSGVCVTTGSAMLMERFVGTKGTLPYAGRTHAEDGQAQSSWNVSYPDLWEGIDLIYDSPPGGILRSTYEVEPGADPGQIGVSYNVSVHLDASNNLVFELETGTMTASAPIAWQEIGGKRVPVDVAFCLGTSQSIVHFSLGLYDPALPLTIDPTLNWNTFLGSTAADFSYAIAVDGSANVYVAGTSFASWGSPVNPYTGTADAFAAKLDSSGATVWTTFMGSAENDWGYGIAVDGSGNVYVAGQSEDPWGSPVNPYANSWDTFVAKLDSSGTTVWTTFMGSNANDYGRAIAVDGSGNIYVTGYSYNTWGSPVNPYTGGGDAFAAKLDGSGVTVWTTFMGSSDNDWGYGIAVDGSGNVYVAGSGVTTWGNPKNAHAGGQDAFVAKLDSSGVSVWNTFMGSAADDEGRGIAIDGSGNVYVAGDSKATWGSPVNAFTGAVDAFAAKLDSNGVSVWNTFMGSSVTDYGRAIAVDGSGNVYVAGESQATWGSPVNPHTGSKDAFAAGLNNNGALHWNTFLGSAAFEIGWAITVDGNGNVYVAGQGGSTWGSPVNPHTQGWDAFVAKLSKEALTPGIPMLLLDSSDE